MRILIACLIISVWAGPTWAADLCEAVALTDIPAIDEPSSILSKGQVDTAVTQYRVEKKTGQASFCSHGGYCYPAKVRKDGQLVDALRLTNCKIGALSEDDDEDYQYYSVDVIRSRVPASALRIDDVENRLLELGLCSACANSAATFYVKKPRSDCAKLVKRTLEGNPVSLRQLRNDPPFCD